MAELKYAKNIVTEPKAHKPAPGAPPPPPGSASRLTRLFYLDGDVVPGAFYYECVWYTKSAETGVAAHTHDFDEILGFVGADPNNPRELGAEFEFWLGDEKYMLTQTCVIFIPKGLSHCPLICRKLDRPVIHFTGGPKGIYQKTVK